MRIRLSILLCCLAAAAHSKSKPKPPEATPLDRYIEEAEQHPRKQAAGNAPGSLWSPDSPFSDLSSDLRARRLDDIVTIVVSDRASAIAKGAVKSARTTSAKASVDSLAGPRKSGWLPNLAGFGSDVKLDGQGETSRENVLTTTLTARVTRVLPNGFLVVEGTKNVGVNGDGQVITVRGVVRPVDLSPANAVASNQLAQLEVKVNGKGVVSDAVRRPALLYRILLGLLPF